MKLEQINEALARGYCSKDNEGKELDASLIKEMAKEVLSLIEKSEEVAFNNGQSSMCSDCAKKYTANNIKASKIFGANEFVRIMKTKSFLFRDREDLIRQSLDELEKGL